MSDWNDLLSLNLRPPCALSRSDSGDTSRRDPATTCGYASKSAQRGYRNIETLEFFSETVAFLFKLLKYEGKSGHQMILVQVSGPPLVKPNSRAIDFVRTTN